MGFRNLAAIAADIDSFKSFNFLVRSIALLNMVDSSKHIKANVAILGWLCETNFVNLLNR